MVFVYYSVFYQGIAYGWQSFISFVLLPLISFTSRQFIRGNLQGILMVFVYNSDFYQGIAYEWQSFISLDLLIFIFFTSRQFIGGYYEIYRVY